jgi:hypothetical protein
MIPGARLKMWFVGLNRKTPQNPTNTPQNPHKKTPQKKWAPHKIPTKNPTKKWAPLPFSLVQADIKNPVR